MPKRSIISPADQALSDAETLQQRGERRKGQAAVTCFQQAIDEFTAAFQHGLEVEKRPDAHFGKAECLQLLASALLDSAAEHVMSPGARQIELDAVREACSLCNQAVEEYKKVLSPDGTMRVDARVDAGNTLATWGEMLVGEAPSTAVGVLQAGVEMYQAALALEADALTYSNLGSALVQLAQAQSACGVGWEGGVGATHTAAVAAFVSAASLSDSSAGDDLPGLLVNWGVGLVEMARHIQRTDPIRACAYLDEAVHRLKSAAQFSRGDPSSLVGLGDALSLRAELAFAAGAEPEGLKLLQDAIAEAYRPALALRRDDHEAVVGMAEACAEVGRVLVRSGETAAAHQHFTEASRFFELALQHPNAIGPFSELADVLYNAACAAALAGNHVQAAAHLQWLIAAGGLGSAEELLQDADLAPCKSEPWFLEIAASLAARAAPPG